MMVFDLFESLGLIGTAIIAIAYFPQIIELWRKKDSTGISITAWVVWFFGTLLIFPQAFSSGDRVFIFFQVATAILVFVVLIQSVFYRKKDL